MTTIHRMTASTAFHAGERAAQARFGVAARMAEIGARVIRREMPQQHREFYAALPFVAIGAADAGGQPWATLLAGAAPGFVQSPDAATLRVDALPPAGDPLAPLLRAGAPLGLLGLEPPTRRRNRANGDILEADARGFTLRVRESFGNCPKHIVPRPLADRGESAPGASRRQDRLDDAMQALVRRADTFFIASQAAGGADVSHRGGPPGFVEVDAEGLELRWPDYAGNLFFNTFGNLLLEPRAGLVVPDFAGGDLLHIAGRAEVAWDAPQRHVRLRVDAALLRPAAFRLRDA